MATGLVLLGILAAWAWNQADHVPKGEPLTKQVQAAAEKRQPAPPSEASKQESVGEANPAKSQPPSPQVELKVTPRLRLLALPPVVLKAGERRTLDVDVEHKNCPGAIELKLQFLDLPAGVLPVGPAVIPPGMDRGSLELLADTAGTTRTVRLQALGTGATDEGQFNLTVIPRPKQPEKEIINSIRPKQPEKEIINSIGMKLVLIPAGKFTMGSPKEEEGYYVDEERHEVAITKPFSLGVYEVTQGQYEKVMGTNPAYFNAANGGGPDHPVENVTWEDAAEFCRRLSRLPEEQRAGWVYRLPTEAEWEYACRGGASAYSIFHYGNSLSSLQANCEGNYPYGGAAKGRYLQKTAKVGSYEPNAFGLYDMHGNVWEWCADYYNNSPRQDPPGSAGGSSRVIRGGGWSFHGLFCRAASRNWDSPTNRHDFLGFRVARAPSGK